MRPWLFYPRAYSGQSQKLVQGLCSGRMIAGQGRVRYLLHWNGSIAKAPTSTLRVHLPPPRTSMYSIT